MTDQILSMKKIDLTM